MRIGEMTKELLEACLYTMPRVDSLLNVFLVFSNQKID